MADIWYKRISIKHKYFGMWMLFSASTLSILAIVGINRPFWGDESHYYETIKLFGQSACPNILSDYPEATPPLFYMLFAALGKVVGYTLVSFRIISLAIAFIVSVLMFVLGQQCIRDARKTFILCIIVMLNPYFLGLSLFVFNDMVALLFLLASAVCFINNRYLFSAMFLGFGLLCRQYVVFALCAMWFTTFLESFHSHNWKAIRRFTVYLAIAVLPLAFLMVLWGGVAPPMGTQKWIVYGGQRWNPQSFIMYVAFSGLYLFPLVIVSIKEHFKVNWILFASILLGLLSFLYRIESSIVAQRQTNQDTVGLAHKAIVFLVGHGFFESVILFVATSFGFWILLTLLQSDLQRMRIRHVRKESMLSFSFYFFLFVMPFSYQHWEKYIILVLPFVAIGWMCMHGEEKAENT
jgi:hypothetical protein